MKRSPEDELSRVVDAIADAEQKASERRSLVERAQAAAQRLPELEADERVGEATSSDVEELRREAEQLSGLRADLDREERIVSALKAKGAELAGAIFAGKVEKAEAGKAARVARIEGLNAEVAAEQEQLASDEDAIARLRREQRRARVPYDDDSAAAAQVADRQQAELATWYAKHRAREPEFWPPELREKIREKIAQLTKIAAEENAKMREAARESLRQAGFPDGAFPAV